MFLDEKDGLLSIWNKMLYVRYNPENSFLDVLMQKKISKIDA